MQSRTAKKERFSMAEDESDQEKSDKIDSENPRCK